MVFSDKERKAKNKARQQTPEYKAQAKARDQTPEYKAKAKARRERPENIAKKKKRESSPEYKAKAKEYNTSPEGKAKAKERQSRPENKAKAKKSKDESRLKILQTYSKRLSNSNIPCCKCCGENFHVDFLAVDHIAGKKQMDSEPELVKLGYSSKLHPDSLQIWIIKNDFPPYFQILCHNCNTAKGLKDNNNQCPMANKTH